MTRVTRLPIVPCAVAILAILNHGIAASPPRSWIELDCKQWLNIRSIRIPDRRAHVVLFFSTVQERETIQLVRKLEELARRRDVAIVAVSPESSARVATFVEKHQIPFPVGAGSIAYRQLGISRFPQVIVTDPTRNGRTITVGTTDLGILDDLLPPQDKNGEDVSGTFDENSAVEQLRRHAIDNVDPIERQRAVELLRTRLPWDEFAALCEDLERAERTPSMIGHIRYQRHLADPSIAEKEPTLPASSLASNAMREDPHAPQWSRVAEYDAKQKSAAQLVEDFKRFAGDEPADLLLRRDIVDQLGEGPQSAEARAPLMDFLPTEHDPGIRLRIVGYLLTVCKPGDFEAADFIEQQLRGETNVRLVRPMMEYTIRYLRTGEE